MGSVHGGRSFAKSEQLAQIPHAFQSSAALTASAPGSFVAASFRLLAPHSVENEPPIRATIACTTSLIASQRARNADLSAVGCGTLK